MMRELLIASLQCLLTPLSYPESAKSLNILCGVKAMTAGGPPG